jgi:hypothetical protein
MTAVVPPEARAAVMAALALLPDAMTSPEAIAELYAIGLQESRFLSRRQFGGGPARGLWQFEMGGGVQGVCLHQTSRYWVSTLCAARKVAFSVPSIYNALEHDDVLAAGMARLLLFTDPRKLPALYDIEGAWSLYSRTWRPGRPYHDTWAEMHAAAVAALEKENPL